MKSVSFQVPDHVLLRQIGHGSYGDVWLGRSVLGTYRAIKIIQRARFEKASPFERELEGIRRFEPISRTDDGFVHILQIGQHGNDYFYYVMEAADDLTCGRILDPEAYVPKTLGKAAGLVGRFPAEECIQMGMTLCLALDKLHRHGLVHRDIKPSNVIFINGAPKLADIGLVTDSENARSFVGTEGFIPPEGPGSKQADIYSLGKTLYEIASARDRLDFPSLPTAFDSFQDSAKFLELNEVLIRACRANPQERYATAREMYQDLALLVSGKSLRRLHILERRWRTAKQVLGAFLAVGAIVSAVVLPILRERQHAEELRQRQIGEHSANGSQKMDEGDFSGALSEYSAVFQLESQKPNRIVPNRIRIASLLSSMPKLTQMIFLDGKANDLEFSADGKRLLAVTRRARVGLYDIENGREVAGINDPGVVHASFSPDGKSVVVASDTDCLSIWKLDGSHVQRFPEHNNPFIAKFSPSGKSIGIGFDDGRIRIINPETGAVRTTFSQKDSVRAIAFSPDEKMLVTGSIDGTACLWDLTMGDRLACFQHPTWVLDAAFSPDGSLLVTGCFDGWARLWRVDRREQLISLMKHEDGVQKVAFSPDGSFIMTASFDSTLRIWDARTTMRLEKNHLFRHSGSVFSAAFGPDAHQFVSGTGDGIVSVWDFASMPLRPSAVAGAYSENGSFLAEIKNSGIAIQGLNKEGPPITDFAINGAVQELAISKEGRTVAAVVAEGNARHIDVWNPLDQHVPAASIPITHTNRVTRLILSPDGSLLTFTEGNWASRLIDWTNRLVDVKTSRDWSLPEPFGHKAWVAFHPSLRRAALGVGAKVTLLENGSPVTEFHPPALVGEVRNLLFSPDGKSLLISQNDDLINPKPAVLVNAETGQALGEFWHRDGILGGAFQASGDRIITDGEDRRANIWNLQTGKEALPPLHHSHQVLSSAFSRDGALIGSTTANYLARIWDGETGAPITPALACESYNYRITFVPDQTKFLTFQSSTQAFLWTLPTTDISPDDALELSHLLNNDWKTAGQPKTSMIAEKWRHLKSRYPKYFTVSDEEIRAWRLAQIRKAVEDNQMAAAQFHRSRLGSAAEPK